MDHVMLTRVRTRRRAGQQVIAFLYRDRQGTVRLSSRPAVYVDGTRADAEDLCRQRGWKIERGPRHA